jgi:Tol biopolymer transport system component
MTAEGTKDGMRLLVGLLTVLTVVGSGRAASVVSRGPVFHDSHPVFSPDGRTIAFDRVGGTSQSIMLVGSDGRHLRTLVSKTFAQYISWSPDSRSLVYSDAGIWRIDLADSNPQLLTEENSEIWQPSWSPDGTSIAYSQFERCYRCTGIWVMKADGTRRHEVVEQGRHPSWSPDGTLLAVTTSETGNLVVRLDGSLAARGFADYVSWSPRGVYLAYTSSGLHLRNIRTGRDRRLNRYLGEKPAWSPDGRTIAGGFRTKVALVRVRDGKLLRVLPDTTTNPGAPSWSPSGQLAFVHRGSCGIDVSKSDGTHIRRITRAC